MTIADFKGLSRVFPELLGSKRNYSTIVTNNIKGEEVIPLLKDKMIVLGCDVAEIGKYNPLFERQTWFSNERDRFFAEYIKDPISALETWTVDASTFEPSLKRKVYNSLPVFVRRAVLKAFGNEHK